jgi:hypothetical protein
MFCVPELIVAGTEGVVSSFHVLRSRARFWRYRGRRVSISFFALPDTFSAVPRALCLVFMFCAHGLVFGDTEGVGSLFHVLRARTSFRRYRGYRVSFSCLALPDSFPAVPRASGLVFMFCAPGLVFDGIEGVGSRFHVLRSRNRFRRYQGCRFPFSCFTRPDSFPALPRASGPVFIFCAPGLIFGVTEGVGTRFHVLCSWTLFRRYRGHLVPFSYFARPDAFPAVPRALERIFIFCAPGLIFGGTVFMFRPPVIVPAVPRALVPFFMFCAPDHISGGTDGVRTRFHILRAQTSFRRYRGRQVQFSCFARPD